ncbi:HAD family hydrolase [Gemmobacter caeruleus]|uniref:HAD family hydrolase n=1 Tax=Gemmobacter caeruleus TaxID=2595004 RepID=UPI0011EE1351|nr:HAD family phosphatase [Gemmobacter caeruleus]
MTPMPKALIFDCDGTLVLTGDLHFDAFTEAFARQGAALDRGFYHARGGLARQGLISEWVAETGAGLDVARAVQDSIDAAARLARAGQCAPNPPVAALARAWGARPSAVASNGEAVVVEAILGGAGLRDLFDTVVTLCDVPAPKPDPAMFLLAAARLGTAPADCLVLEDSAQGMEAARRAGIPALDVREAPALAAVAALTQRLAAATPALPRL